jgi:PKD repeat protein
MFLKKQFFYHTFLALCCYLFWQESFAQDLHQEQCGFNHAHQQLLKTDANYVQAVRQSAARWAKVNQGSIVGGRTEATIYRIPLVVHVMHLGEAVGTGTNICDEQIFSAVTALNQDYRKMAGTAGFGAGVDTEIEFYLAARDPFNNATNGINRVNATGVANYSTQGITTNPLGNELAVKALSNWDNTKYYNIWIVSEIDDNNAGAGTQGYAYFPGAPNGTDGSVILYNAFGTRGTLKSFTKRNATATHEIGHGLNLFHTFEGDGTGATCPTEATCATGGDQVCDTPLHRRDDNGAGCPTGGTSCAGVGMGEVRTNYMNYNNTESCYSMFSAGQATRMRDAIANDRLSLTTSTAANPVTVPVCNFVTDVSLGNVCNPYPTSINICAGTTVQFYDRSTQLPTAWAWTFAGGSITNSTAQNPSVTYNTPGSYTVTLVATNSIGAGTMVTKTAHVNVYANAAAACTPTFSNTGDFGYGIYNVNLQSINNTTTNSNGYTNATCSQTTTLTANTNYTLSINIGRGNGSAGQEAYYRVWIDYNNDGVFNNATELIMSGTKTALSTETFTQNFTTPISPTTNTVLRMRVANDQAIDPFNTCVGSLFTGEVEDYGVVFVAPMVTPTITTTGTLSAFTSCAGSVSAEQSYTVAGTNLTANIVITAPTGFELSLTSGGTFSGTLNLSPTSGTVNTTTIFVRQTSGASNGASGNITHTSTGAAQKDVAIPVSVVNALPTITLGTINSVNTSATSFTIPYTATTGSPNQYSITTGGGTPMPSFVAVTNQALPASPITVTIPASAANTYNFTLTVRNTTTGCVSANVPFTLTVTAIPSTTIYVRTDGNDANDGLTNTAGGAKLTLQGAFTAVGDGNTIVLNAGTYTEVAILTGKSATLQGVGNPTVQTVIVNGAGKTLTLSGNVNISQMLDLQAGDLVAGGNLTLLATATQQAMLIQGAGTTITGNVNVQRYLRANSGTTGLGYRFLSSPVTSATFNEISELSPVVNAAFNTSATPGKVAPFPTVYSYDATKAGDPAKTFTTSPFPEFDKGWVSPTSLSDAMLVGRGYTVNTAANQVVSITGTLNNGNVTVPIVTGNSASLGYNLVGNPYPSPIRWSAVRALSTGVNDAIYQNMATGQYTGSWASFVGGVGTNGATDSIAVMQGFFVVANAAGNINFNNTVRATNYSNPNSFRTENGANHKGLVRLAMTNSANKTDETVVYFRDEATETFDSQYDAYKFQLNGGNFSNIYTTDNKAEKANLYAINALPTLTDDLVVPITLQAWTDGEQRIALTEKVNFSREVNVFLKDKMTNTLHDFGKGAYVTNLSKGVTAGRYELVFKPQFTAEELSNGVLAIYPNPSKEKSTLTLTDDFKGELTLRLIDVTGREVWKNTLQKRTTVLQTTVDLSTLPTGLYMVELLGKNKLVQKIVKE